MNLRKRMIWKNNDKWFEETFGYTKKEIIAHIEGHPNFKKIAWEHLTIDHVFPIALFKRLGIFDKKIVNALSNIQPLSLKKNVKKGCKYNKKAAIKWLNEMGINLEGNNIWKT